MTARAFLVEPVDVNVSAASDYGSVVTLFEGNRPSMWTIEFKEEVIKRLAAYNFDPAFDYFIVAGQQVPILMALGAMVGVYGPVQCLYFDASTRQYHWDTFGDNYETRNEEAVPRDI